MPSLDILITTFIKRPYVFAFLAAYLVISILNYGKRRTALFLISGYLIAWISEGISIRTGFPYGWYFYIYENLQGEWLNWGVPVWDSLSYTFLCFAGMSLAESCCHSRDTTGMTNIVKISLLGALFVVILDIVIDPLAHQGDKWFLGKIYYYPYPGYYFQVPVANFIGWFFVAFAVIFLNRFVWYRSSWFRSDQPKNISQLLQLMGPGLYFGIFIFNWLITLAIGDYVLGLVDLVWVTIPVISWFNSRGA